MGTGRTNTHFKQIKNTDKHRLSFDCDIKTSDKNTRKQENEAMTDKTDSHHSDISNLEMLIAHQDKQIQELNEVVIDQGKEIDALKRYVERTKSKLDEIENSIGDLGQENTMSIADEAAANKPPHY